MLNKAYTLRLFAACAAVLWCLVFVRRGSTDKSMVRAIFLQKSAQGWTAGFLYQAPEGSADAAEATAEVAYCAAEGQSLEQAIDSAEKALPQQANYRLCDYVMLGETDNGAAVLEAYSQAVLQRQCGRLAARVVSCDFSGREFSAATETADALPEKLLRCVKQAASTAPRLYEREAGLILPILELDENGIARRDEGLFLRGSCELTLSANQMQAALMLTGKGGERTFKIGEEKIIVSRALCSLTVLDGGFVLTADCALRGETRGGAAGQKHELETLLEETAELFWQNGSDILDIGAALRLRDSGAAALSPTKNACPKLRADVRFYDLF